MRCVIPGRSVKLFAKAIHCLSKVGDELYLEALEQGLALRTVNSSRSAYACFMFNSSFFLSYNDGLKDLPDESQAEDLLKCKIAIKSCLSAFKSQNSIEKSVDRCKIELNISESRLVFLLYCRHGITKTYNLAFQECETLQAVFSKDLCPNLIATQAKVLNDTVFNFPNNQEEITLGVAPEILRVKNYVDDEPDPNKVIHTEMTLVPEEFDNYQIGVDTEVTFCLKELRAILSFGEYASQPINIHFETGGKPIVFCLDGDASYEADFVLATLVDQMSGSQSSQASAAAAEPQPTTSSARANRKSRNPANQSQETKRQSQPEGTRHDGLDCSGYNGHSQGNPELEITDVKEEERELGEGEMIPENPIPKKKGKITKNDKTVAEDCSTKQRKLDSSSTAMDDFFSDSLPYQDMFSRSKKDLSVIREESQEHSETSLDGSARPIQTPPSTVTDTSFLKNVDMPSPGVSCIGLSATPNKWPVPSVERAVDQSVVEQMDDEDYDFVPGTPPSKKFKSMFFSAPTESQQNKKVGEGVVLAVDSDDDSD